jgi:hypothetical protein
MHVSGEMYTSKLISPDEERSSLRFVTKPCRTFSGFNIGNDCEDSPSVRLPRSKFDNPGNLKKTGIAQTTS